MLNIYGDTQVIKQLCLSLVVVHEYIYKLVNAIFLS